jgi:hypothetical protein
VRNGKIQKEWAERRIDQSTRRHALWEQGTPGPIELALVQRFINLIPSTSAGRWPVLAPSLSSSARPVLSHMLLEVTLGSLTRGSRLYVYADRTMENGPGIFRGLANRASYVLPRLGPRPPADWLVVDRGRSAVLLLGPDADTRRWYMHLDGPLARALFDAFQALYWHHSSRESLPDQAGVGAWRAPLPAPFPAPGPHVRLAAGDLYVGVGHEDPMVDAELRVTPRHADPGRAKRIVVPPRGAGATVDLDLADKSGPARQPGMLDRPRAPTHRDLPRAHAHGPRGRGHDSVARVAPWRCRGLLAPHHTRDRSARVAVSPPAVARRDTRRRAPARCRRGSPCSRQASP